MPEKVAKGIRVETVTEIPKSLTFQNNSPKISNNWTHTIPRAPSVTNIINTL